MLIDDMLLKLLTDNQILEDRIMEHINVLTRVSEDNRLRMKTELRVEVKEEIQPSEGHLTTHIESLEISVDYLDNKTLIFHHDIVATSIPIQEDSIVAHNHPSFDFYYYDLS